MKTNERASEHRNQRLPRLPERSGSHQAPKFNQNEVPPPSPESTVETAPPDAMLDSVASLIREYLVCDDHQLTVLALWILHTWSHHAFPTTPYLHIHSPEPECGKTTCLQLLSLLSWRTWLSSGPDPTALMRRLVSHEEESQKTEIWNRTHSDAPRPLVLPKPLPVMLLDNYHHTLSSSERQPLVAMLCSGSTSDSRVLCRLGGRRTADLCFFGPKAFAGNGPLPLSLASLCIPIRLQRKRPSDSVRRFDDGYANYVAAPLVRWLEAWSDEAWNRLEDLSETPACIPNLTARQQDCADPLLRLAATVGGHWPEKAAAAIESLFINALAGDSLRLLADIRYVFTVCDSPPYLSSQDLISVLAGLENRPWGGWTMRQARLLARLLRRYDVSSRLLSQRQENSDPPDSERRKKFRGYRLCDFRDAWERYLPTLPSDLLRAIADRTFQPCAVGASADGTDGTHA